MYCETCEHNFSVCQHCHSEDGVPNMYKPMHEPEPSDIIPITHEQKTIHGTLDMKTGMLTMTPIRTNADRIRSMTDEELADVIAEGFCSGRLDKCDNYKRCTDCTLDWLKEEVKE